MINGYEAIHSLCELNKSDDLSILVNSICKIKIVHLRRNPVFRVLRHLDTRSPTRNCILGITKMKKYA